MKYSLIVLVEQWYVDTSDYVMDLYDIFSNLNESFEILIVANGTGRKLRKDILTLTIPAEKLKAFEFNTKISQAVCLKAMLKESRGEILVVTEAYQQITRASFKNLLASIDDQSDILCPWRQHRVDTRFNQLQSTLFNRLMTLASGSRMHDLSCTVKVFRREVLEEIALYGSMFRFLPLLARRKGYRTAEIPCEHYQQKSKTGVRKLALYFNALIDVIILYFNTFFSRKPLRFFSLIGVGFLLVGILIMIVVLVQKSLFGQPIGGRPALLLSIFIMVMGSQVACVGLLGEIVAFIQGRHVKEYSVELEI